MWLKRRAAKNQANGSSRTYVVCDGETVIGYYCLAAGAIGHAEAPSTMKRNRPDPVLILAKSAGWGWPTVRAIILSRVGTPTVSTQALDNAFANFERLSPATAQRVMRFWQSRPAASGTAAAV